MGQLVDDLLRPSQLGRKERIEREPVDLSQIARQVIGNLRVESPG